MEEDMTDDGVGDEGWRFTKSFSCQEDSDRAAAVDFFGRHGFVIFRDAASAAQCREARQDIWSQVEEESEGFDLKDQSTWENAKLTRFGMSKQRGPQFRPSMLRLKQSDNLHRCFADVLGEQDIVCSHDRWLLHRKTKGVLISPEHGKHKEMPHWRTARSVSTASLSLLPATRAAPCCLRFLQSTLRFQLYSPSIAHCCLLRNIHLDMNPWEYTANDPQVYRRVADLTYSDSANRDFVREGNDVAAGMGRCVQGILNLKDNFDDESGCNGGTIVVPGFHRQFDDWVRGELPGVHCDASQRVVGSMQYKVANDSPLQRQAVRATLREGSLLIWDQRTVHGSAPNTSCRNRIGIAIKFFPTASMTPARKQNRADSLFRKMRATGFLNELSETGMTVFGLNDHARARRAQAQARTAAEAEGLSTMTLRNCGGSTDQLIGSANGEDASSAECADMEVDEDSAIPVCIA